MAADSYDDFSSVATAAAAADPYGDFSSPAEADATGKGDPTAYAKKLASTTDPEEAGKLARKYNPSGDEPGFYPLKALKTVGSLVGDAAASAGTSLVNLGAKAVGADPAAANAWVTKNIGGGASVSTPEAMAVEQGLASSAPAQAVSGAVKAADTAIGKVSPTAQGVVREAAKDVADIGNVAGAVGLARGATAASGAAKAEAAAAPHVPEPTPAAPPSPAEQILAQPHPAPAEPPPASKSGTVPAAAPAAVPLSDVQNQFTRAAPAGREARAQTLRDAGVAETRESALSGDVKDTADDYTTGQLSNKNPEGKRMGDVIASERQALQTHADGLIADSGGPAGNDTATNYQRGTDIAEAPNKFRQFIDQDTQRAYTAARAKAGNTPFDISDVEKTLSDLHPDFMGTQEGQALYTGVQTFMKKNGMVPKNAIEMVLNPATVDQVERLRQYLGNNWSPRTNRLIGTLKDSLDDSVAKQAGGDIYETARALRRFRANAFDDPKGVSSLIESPDGIASNNPVQTEKIPQHIENMSVDQMNHFVGVLKQASVQAPELREAAVRSLNGVRSTFANGVKAAGDSSAHFWNQKAVNQYLARQAPKMAQVFTPEELARFKTLNDAGNILDIDKRYKGAAIQGNQLLKTGLKGIEHLATPTGGVVGHVPGGIAGHLVGKAAEKMGHGLDRAAIEKRIVQL